MTLLREYEKDVIRKNPKVQRIVHASLLCAQILSRELEDDNEFGIAARLLSDVAVMACGDSSLDQVAETVIESLVLELEPKEPM